MIRDSGGSLISYPNETIFAWLRFYTKSDMTDIELTKLIDREEIKLKSVLNVHQIRIEVTPVHSSGG